MSFDELTVYQNGRFLKYRDAHVGLLTHAFAYGSACFEGLRGYWNPDREELYLLEPTAHFGRLRASAKVLLMSAVESVARMTELAAEVCRRNGVRTDVWMRPVLYKSDDAVGVRLDGIGNGFAITAVPGLIYMDTTDGINACVSSWRRVGDNAAPARAKISGSYVNLALAKTEARLNGFDEAIVLTEDGHVSESSSANVLMVTNGMIVSPPASADNLEGITKRVIRSLAAAVLDVPFVDRPIGRSELYGADELLVVGTALGIAWIRSLDHRVIGEGTQGSVARALSGAYDDAVRGRLRTLPIELVPVYDAAHVLTDDLERRIFRQDADLPTLF